MALYESPVAIVTGGNRGIGREVARQLALAGICVVIGSRDLEAGETVAAEIAGACIDQNGGNAQLTAVGLDVTASVGSTSPDSAIAQITERFGRLDILINNAGRMVEVPAVELTADDLRTAFVTNVCGVAEMVRVSLPLLSRSRSPRIVNVSSTTGSLTYTAAGRDFGGDHTVRTAYSTSKAALNMLTLHYHRAFAADENLRHIKINAATPGYVATDMNHGLGVRTVEQGARIIVDLALTPEDGPSGGYFNENGPVPW